MLKLTTPMDRESSGILAYQQNPGFHDRNNLCILPFGLTTKLRKRNPSQVCDFRMKLFHSFLPFVTWFQGSHDWTDDSFRYLWLSVYYCVLPAICAWCFIWFCVVSVPLCMIILAHSDKLLLGRIIFDVPNFCLALTYILVIESNSSSALSVTFSGFFLGLLFIGNGLPIFFMDMLRTPSRIISDM